ATTVNWAERHFEFLQANPTIVNHPPDDTDRSLKKSEFYRIERAWSDARMKLDGNRVYIRER
ncbi:11069_t:CDS:2, partial [Acaulospora morrowiae]